MRNSWWKCEQSFFSVEQTVDIPVQGGVNRARRGLQGSVSGQSFSASFRGTTIGTTTITTGTSALGKVTVPTGTTTLGMTTTTARGARVARPQDFPAGLLSTALRRSRVARPQDFPAGLLSTALRRSRVACPQDFPAGQGSTALGGANDGVFSQDLVPGRLVVLIIMVKTLSEDRVQQRFVKQISQFPRVFSQDRGQQRLVELSQDRVH